MWRFYKLVIFSVLFVAPSLVDAAHLYLSSDSYTHGLMDTFYVPVRVDTKDGECINTVDVTIDYNPDEISVKDILIGDSVLTLWTKKPVIERDGEKEIGVVSFSGGVPGGYCGRVLGDPGQTNVLLKLVVTSAEKNFFDTETKKTQIIIDPKTKVYLHDGKGTEAVLSTQGVDLLFDKTITENEDAWMKDIKADTIAPQLFDITLIKGPSEGNSKSYIIFNTTDKQSGIDHYEVLETDPDKFGFLAWLPGESYWIEAESPYVLRDQKLRSKIMVKAVDKNGNERVVAYTPPMSLFSEITHPSLLLPIAALFIVVILVLLFVLKIMKKKKKVTANNDIIEDEIKEDEE